MARLILLNFLAHPVAVCALKVRVKLNYDHVFSNLEELKDGKGVSNQETKTPIAYSICPVLDLFFSQLFQVKLGELALSYWNLQHVHFGFSKRTLLVPVPDECPFTWGTSMCTSVRQRGTDAACDPQQYIPETSGELGSRV